MISKIGIFILLVSFLHLVCSFPPAPVDTNKCKRGNGDFPKPGSLCRSYYSCTNWRPVEMECPEDHHFFPAGGYCVWPEEYPCLEKPKSKECPLPKGKFLKPGTKCKIYYDCCNGMPTEKRCGTDQIFDDVRGKCEWSELTTCTEEPKSKVCVRPDGKFLKPGTGCKVFYECRNGISSEKRCVGDLLFDPNAEECEWPEVYTCIEDVRITKSTTQSTSTPSTITSTLISTSTKEKVITATSNPVTPTLVRISTERKIITTTSNPILPKIITPDSDEDSSEEGKSSEEDKRSSTKSKTASSSEEGKSSEEDKRFSTKSKTASTPPNVSIFSSSIFDEVSSTKDSFTPSSIFTVDQTETPSSTNDKSTELPVALTSSIKSSSTIENSSKSVSSTTSSDDGLTVSRISTTSSTDEFDKKTYTYPEIVTEEITQGTETIKKEGTDSTRVTSGFTDSVTFHIFCPKSDGHFPHPNDRHKFIACVAGIPTIMNCPENLVYDHKRKSCEYDRRKK